MLNYARNIKYFINEGFFKKKSSEMYWILGLIYSDGNLSGREVSIALHKQDVDVFEKIKVCMKTNIPISKRKDNCYRLRICRKEIKNSLIKLGLIENKSLILKFPKVPKKYLSHFIRRLIDGDGCIDSHSGNLRIRLVSGSKKFIDKITEILNELNFIVTHNKYPSCYALNTFDKKFGEWIYENSDGIRMDRKYNNYLIAIEKDKRKYGKIRPKDLEFLMNNYNKGFDFCKKYFDISKEQFDKKVYYQLNKYKWKEYYKSKVVREC